MDGQLINDDRCPRCDFYAKNLYKTSNEKLITYF